MIKNFVNYIVVNFGYHGVEDFYSSTIHHNLTILTIPVALIGALIEKYTGLHYITLLSFGVLILMEFITGISASKIKNIPIESKRFSRFGLKLLVWISLIFIINSIKMEYEGKTDVTSLMAHALFSWLHGALYVYVNLEYLISVLENLDVISGNDAATSKLSLIKKKLSTFIDKLLM
jgi:hypothetical protein